MAAARCPVCNDALPASHRDRRVLPNGIVVCDRATCEERAQNADDCLAPGERGPCRRDIYAAGLCRAHYDQRQKRGSLSVLRRRSPPGEQLARITVRLDAEVLEALGDEPAQRAREIVTEWARRPAASGRRRT